MFLILLLRRNSWNVRVVLKRTLLNKGCEFTSKPPTIKDDCSPVTPKPLKCYKQCSTTFREKSVCCSPPYSYVKPPYCFSPTFPSASCLSQLASKKCK